MIAEEAIEFAWLKPPPNAVARQERIIINAGSKALKSATTSYDGSCYQLK